MTGHRVWQPGLPRVGPAGNHARSSVHTGRREPLKWSPLKPDPAEPEGDALLSPQVTEQDSFSGPGARDPRRTERGGGRGVPRPGRQTAAFPLACALQRLPRPAAGCPPRAALSPSQPRGPRCSPGPHLAHAVDGAGEAVVGDGRVPGLDRPHGLAVREEREERVATSQPDGCSARAAAAASLPGLWGAGGGGGRGQPGRLAVPVGDPTLRPGQPFGRPAAGRSLSFLF